MGEAIISRSGGGINDPVPIVPGSHTVRVTMKDWNNKPVVNYLLACNDGTAFYNYTTNEKGQTIFVCNSGKANIQVRNLIDGVKIVDIVGKWYNIDAPIGLSTDLKINLEKGPEYVDFHGQNKFNSLIISEGDLYIIGGGGGGGMGYDNSDDDKCGGYGGGAGYCNIYNNIPINRSILTFNAGSGGHGGYNNRNSSTRSGASGGISRIIDSSYYASGGEGGRFYTGGAVDTGIAKGGLGNGGQGRRNSSTNFELFYGENSILNFAGGGGGGGGYYTGDKTIYGGSPYGGNGQSNGKNVGDGKNGGGGGGGKGDNSNGGNGGNGMMRLYLHY